MQLDDYDDGLLGKLKLKPKSPKKLLKSKKLKKIAKPLAHAAAAYFTGGASLALSASMLKAKQDRKSAEAMQAAQIAAEERMFSQASEPLPVSRAMVSAPQPVLRAMGPAPQPVSRAMVSAPQPVSRAMVSAPQPVSRAMVSSPPAVKTALYSRPVAPVVAPYTVVTQTAPAADSVRAYLPDPTPTNFSSSAELPDVPTPGAGVSHAKKPPAWMVPAVIAAGVAMVMFSRRGA